MMTVTKASVFQPLGVHVFDHFCFKKRSSLLSKTCYLKCWVLSVWLDQNVKQCIVLSSNGSLWLSSLDLCPSCSFESGYMIFLPEVNAYFSFVFISCCLQSSIEKRCSTVSAICKACGFPRQIVYLVKKIEEVHSICLELCKYS